MRRSVEFSDRASSDLQSISAYIRQDNVGASDAMLEKIRRAIQQLESFPESGQKTSVSGVRRLVVRPYLVFYQVEIGHVVILSVQHGKTQEASNFQI